MPDIDGGFRWETAPKRITFNMTPFNTYKSINNIFGSHITKIRDRVNLFIHHPEWYQQRGIPHTLGILLHGRPGCGKTSLIKAIARDTNRHVFNISLRTTTTQRQLINLLFDENISFTNATNETSIISIPLDQRIYVIEDIDCMSDVVLDRALINELPEQDINPLESIDTNELVSGMPGSMNTPIDFLYSGLFVDMNKSNFDSRNNIQSSRQIDTRTREQNKDKKTNTKLNTKSNTKLNTKSNKEEITLSFLLNLLDGVLETPNRILIITSNYPERLDKALIRPGRIDLNIHFDYADMEMILDMFRHFYNLSILEAKKLELNSKIDKMFTPAEIIAVLCNNYKTADDAVVSLNNLALSKK